MPSLDSNAGEPLVDPTLWQEALDCLRLPPQQRRIVELLLQGLSYDSVATELRIHHSTVRTYLARVCQRLDVANRNELILVVAAKAIELAKQQNHVITSDDNASDDVTSAD